MNNEIDGFGAQYSLYGFNDLWQVEIEPAKYGKFRHLITLNILYIQQDKGACNWPVKRPI